MKPVHPFGCLALLRSEPQVVGDVDALDDQHSLVFFDLAPGL